MNSSDLKQRVTQKAERYKFAGASDEEKSELLKDVLAMANTHQDGTGYLLLGFKERALILQRPWA